MCFKNRLPGAQNDFPVGNFPRFCYSLTTPQGWIYLDSLVVNSPGLVTTPWRVYTLGSCLQFRTAKSELNPMSILGMSTATKISFSMKKKQQKYSWHCSFHILCCTFKFKNGFLTRKVRSCTGPHRLRSTILYSNLYTQKIPPHIPRCQ